MQVTWRFNGGGLLFYGELMRKREFILSFYISFYRFLHLSFCHFFYLRQNKRATWRSLICAKGRNLWRSKSPQIPLTFLGRFLIFNYLAGYMAGIQRPVG